MEKEPNFRVYTGEGKLSSEEYIEIIPDFLADKLNLMEAKIAGLKDKTKKEDWENIDEKFQAVKKACIENMREGGE